MIGTAGRHRVARRGVGAALLLSLGLLGGCATSPPSDLSSSCAIFKEKGGWYGAVEDSYKKWGVPPQVQLAIIYQESRFKYDAKPPRGTLLWVIPWFRSSSAYGYAQVKDGTWDWYKEKTGNWGADRDDFEDAVDFIGWYGAQAHKTLGISKWDAYRQYLAYHEGLGGYRKGSYRKKAWLVAVAHKVDARARTYGAQLARCRDQLDSGWSLWPF